MQNIRNINSSRFMPGYNKLQQNNRYTQINQYPQVHENQQNQQKIIEQNDKLIFNYPVDFTKCEDHRLANIVFKQSQEEQENQYFKKKCQCCKKIIGRQPEPTISYDPPQFAMLGPGIPLYFLFLKYIIKILIVCLVIFGIYAFISNLNEYECSLYKKCQNNNFFSKESIMNAFSSESVVLTQKYILLGLLVILMILLQWIRYKIKEQKQLIDQILISPSDYAIMIRRLPDGTQKKDIMEMLNQTQHFLQRNQKQQTNNLRVEKILFAKNITQYNQMKENNLLKFKEIVKTYNDQNRTPDKKDQIVRKQIYQMFKNYKLPLPQIKENLSSAIVVFKKQLSKQYFLHNMHGGQRIIHYCWSSYKPLSNMHRVKGEYVSIERAPQPDDIIWQNCGYSMSELLFRRCVSFGIGLILLLLGGLFQFLLIKWRVNNIQVGNTTLQYIFSILSALLITAINYLIQIILIKSASYQKHDTHTQLKISLTIKIVFLQFINSGIAMILANAIVYLPNYRSYKSLITWDVISMMLTNAIVNNIIVFIFTYFQINSIWARFKLQHQKQIYTQMQANKIYEAPPVQLQYKYAYIFKTFWLTVFFFPTVPIVILISILGLLINYFVELYLFSSKYTIPNMLSAKLSTSTTHLLNYTFVWVTLGSFLIHLLKADFHYNQIGNSVMIPHFICLVLSIISIVAPLDTLGKKIFSKNQDVIMMNKQYKQFEDKFESTYEQTNPAYNGGIIYQKQQSNLNKELFRTLLKLPNSQFYEQNNY